MSLLMVSSMGKVDQLEEDLEKTQKNLKLLEEKLRNQTENINKISNLEKELQVSKNKQAELEKALIKQNENFIKEVLRNKGSTGNELSLILNEKDSLKFGIKTLQRYRHCTEE